MYKEIKRNAQDVDTLDTIAEAVKEEQLLAKKEGREEAGDQQLEEAGDQLLQVVMLYLEEVEAGDQLVVLWLEEASVVSWDQLMVLAEVVLVEVVKLLEKRW